VTAQLSIVICSYNRAEYILDALNSVKNQDLDKTKFELVVVNNNSTDDTEAICKKFEESKGDLQYTYCMEFNQGLSWARNKGIEVAKGKYISFIDDDAICEPDFARNMLAAFEQNPEFEAVGGKVLPIYPDNKEPKWMSKYLNGLVAKVDMGDKQKEFISKYPVGCNMAFHASVFKEIGGFNVSLTLRNDDKYIFLKYKKSNKRILYVPNVVVHHNIDAYRLEDEYLNKLCTVIGSSERIRLQDEPKIEMIKKPIEYFVKYLASMILALQYYAKGEFTKGFYLIKVRRIVLFSFFKKQPKYYK